MTPVVSLVMLLLLPAQDALSSEALASRAEEEFARGVELRQSADKARPHFLAAAQDFAELQRRGARNPQLSCNLGNAYFLGGNTAQAILAYRQGLRLAPGDSSLRANLEKAREKVIYPDDTPFGRPPADTRPPWLPRLAGGWAFALGTMLYLLAWVAFTRWFMVRRSSFFLLGVLLLGCAAGISVWIWQSDSPVSAGRVVIIAENGVLLRKGNGLTYPPRYDTPVNQGVEARLLFEKEDWLQIELAGGEVGWIPRKYALLDEPDR